MRAAPLPTIAAFACMALLPSVASAEMVRIGGSDAALPTVRMLGARLAAMHAGFQSLVLPGLGSEGGLRALSVGMIDLALATRPLRPEEEAAGAHEAACLRAPAATSRPESGGMVSRVVLRAGDHDSVVIAHRAMVAPAPDPEGLRICMILPASPSPAALRLAAYARSDEGKAALERLGAAPEE